jgi:hypothetical protein
MIKRINKMLNYKRVAFFIDGYDIKTHFNIKISVYKGINSFNKKLDFFGLTKLEAIQIQRRTRFDFYNSKCVFLGQEYQFLLLKSVVGCKIV